jgi:hypothetical protein
VISGLYAWLIVRVYCSRDTKHKYQLCIIGGSISNKTGQEYYHIHREYVPGISTDSKIHQLISQTPINIWTYLMNE